MKISATGLGKRFSREWIFRNLTLEFESGTIYAVTGPNGSGKSTLLQVLWGQVPPSEGSLTYRAENSVIQPAEIYPAVSIAAPYMELVEEFTLREMVEFHFKFKKIRGGRTTGEVLEHLELTHASDKLISEFSSGMRQRLKLGLAMLANTPLLFLDEPTTNLDSQSASWYMANLLALPPETLIIIASNQQNEYPDTAKKVDISAGKRLQPPENPH